MKTAVWNIVKHIGKPKNLGYCTICEGKTLFIRTAEWLRDNYICSRCNSIPRHRALIMVLAEQFPAYRTMRLHESSPSGAASAKLAKECPEYTPTYFFPDLDPGNFRNGFRCENLENMTFDDGTFDLTITQDVMEHVLNPGKAFADIARSLKPGGAHVFTVPVYRGKPTIVRATEENGKLRYLKEMSYLRF